MAVKSIVDIDVNDAKFKAFSELFEKYRSALAKMPGAWASVDKSAKTSFEAVGAALLAQNEVTKREAKAAKDAATAAKEQEGAWARMARSTKGVAGNIEKATRSLLRWTKLTGVLSGLVGAGGLYGIDRLALGVNYATRAAQGLNLTYGERRAFDVNLGRVVDPGFLGNVNEALHDVTKRYAFYGAGLGEAQLRGDTAQVAALLLPSLKQIVDRTPNAQLAQVLQARGLDQFISLQEAERLKATAPGDLANYIAGFQADRGALGLSPATQKAWQDFSVQMSRAGNTIETVLIRGLTGLIGPLGDLSKAVTGAISQLLGQSGPARGWIELLAGGITHFAAWLSSPEFKSDVTTFAGDVDKVAKALGRAMHWIAGWESDSSPEITSNTGPLSQALKNAKPGSRSINNPLNLRPPGSKTGFMQYDTLQAGLFAAAQQLRRDQDIHHLNTIRAIISDPTWGWDSGDTPENLKSYVADVSKWTGYGAEQPLDLHDVTTLSTLEAAMARRETGLRATPGQLVTIMINNNTGGNAVVTTSQVAQ